MTLPRAARSLCPSCLRLVDAVYEAVPEAGYLESVHLRKHCPVHGAFSVPVWRVPAATTRGDEITGAKAPPAGAAENAPEKATEKTRSPHGDKAGVLGFAVWSRPKRPSFPTRPATPAARGCPFDCGLCPEHGQHTCTALVEVTARCDLGCPVCYAAAGEGADTAADPTLERLLRRLDALYRVSGPCNIQFSGGEPTQREDLPLLAAHARGLGFGLIQVNSNGLRLARDPAYAALLKTHGVDSVYLQWDGVRETSFRALRGRACLEAKQTALRHAIGAGLGVVLVATVVRGVNDEELGDLLRLAVAAGPTVRGLHLQPVAAFGRTPWPPSRAPRLTLPELIHLLARQAPGWVRPDDFHPPGCEHELCSCSALYTREPGPQGDELRLIPGEAACCDPGPAAEGARKARQFVARHWTAADSFSRFVANAGVERRFTLSAMAFQDALSLDLARVRGCCIHVAGDEGRLIPFCLHNLTAEGGTPLYRTPGEDHDAQLGGQP